MRATGIYDRNQTIHSISWNRVKLTCVKEVYAAPPSCVLKSKKL